jgi:hypothetical protein
MKVVCNYNMNGRIPLTIGKQYEIIVISQDPDTNEYYYKILNDAGCTECYLCEDFVSIAEYRNEIIDEILG